MNKPKNTALTFNSSTFPSAVGFFEPLETLFHQSVDDFFSLANSSSILKGTEGEVWSKTHPRVNVFKNKSENTLVIDFVVPYYKKEDLELQIDDSTRLIELTGKNVSENIPESDHVVRTVSRSGFKKTIKLDSSEPYDLTNVKANHQNGILRLILPSLKELPKNRKVDIV
jgi:HSP20 family molecular chaperone IbpA